MKKRWLSILAAGLMAAAGLAPAEGQPPPAGGRLPDFSLPAPQAAAERDYLGLPAKRDFKPADVQAEVLIIQIFNMY
jgi:hypothetical protein